MNDLTSFWLPGAVILGIIFVLAKSLFLSTQHKYRDVIVDSYDKADFYYGKQGSEFPYSKDKESSIWSQIAKRYGWKCYKCGRRVYPLNVAVKKFLGKRFRVPGRREIHVDHIIPYIYGGEGTLENGRAACYRCNIRRKAKIDNDCLNKVRELGKKIYIGKKVPKFEYKRTRR